MRRDFWRNISRMNRDLEALLKAYDACLQARGNDAKRLEAIYESHLDDRSTNNLSRDTLHKMVRFAYNRWSNAQKKTTALPPKA